MQAIKIQTYTSYTTKRQVPTDILLSEYVDTVRSGYDVPSIAAARAAGKGSDLYTLVKNNRKIFTFNFIFNGLRNNASITGATGLLYLDIDDQTFDVTTLDKSRVFVLHKSFGGLGWTILLRVDGLTLENLSASVQHIAAELNISAFIDKGAKKASQCTVCSFDPEIYVNEEPFVFNAVEGSNQEKVSSTVINRDQNVIQNDTFLELPEMEKEAEPIRLTDASDLVPEDADYAVFPEGVMVARAFVRPDVAEGERHNYLYVVARQIAALNPNHSRNYLYYYMKKIAAFGGIANPHTLSNILDSVFKEKAQGRLFPVKNQKRTIIYRSDLALTKKEKSENTGRIMGEIKRDRTRTRIEECLETWDAEGKITADAIAAKLDLGIATVKRYYGEFKDAIKIYNAGLKKRN